MAHLRIKSHSVDLSSRLKYSELTTSCPLDFATNKMQDRMQEKFRGQPSVPSSGSHRRLSRKSSTYLAKIAVVLRDAPGHMLTFAQLMDKLLPIGEDRKSIENNIRVCLSTNKCFVKIPVVPDALDSKRNFWKLDSAQVTAKMARRHFKGLLQLFPELASGVEPESGRSRAPRLHSPPAQCVQIRCEVKFSGPFSIESLLRRDSPSARASTTGRTSSPVCSTEGSIHHTLTAPYFTRAHSGYITHGPAVTYDALRFCL